MKRVFTTPNPALAHHVKNLLEQRGIVATVQGELRGAALGELPPIECWIEVWVAEDDRYEEARTIVDELTTPDPTGGRSWTCPVCGEEIEPQFAECWLCQSPAPEASPADGKTRVRSSVSVSEPEEDPEPR